MTGQRNRKKVTRDAQKWKKLRRQTEQQGQADDGAFYSDDDIFPRGSREHKAEGSPLLIFAGELTGAGTHRPNEEVSVNETGDGVAEDHHAQCDTEPTTATVAPLPTDTDRRITMSHGISYAWNPTMNATTGPLLDMAPQLP